MIGWVSKLKRADHQKENGKVGGLTRAMISQDWTIGKDVQAYLPNRLVVLLSMQWY
jgi:hypothetical protein